MIGRQSRNNYAAIIQVLNSAGQLVEFSHLDIRPTLTNILQSDNVRFTPSQSDNWSRISWRRLGDGRRWWIIADFSQVVDPWIDLNQVTSYNYLTQLSADIPAGLINSFTVKDDSQIVAGMNLLVENLDPTDPVSFECNVTEVNTEAVVITPVTAPAIPFALSRVSQIAVSSVQLTCPSVQRAFFESSNFDNPLNVLVQ